MDQFFQWLSRNQAIKTSCCLGWKFFNLMFLDGVCNPKILQLFRPLSKKKLRFITRFSTEH